MNKQEMMNKVAGVLKVSKAMAGQAIDAVLEVTKAELKKGNRVAFAGFGTFSVTERKARTGRNPQTGAAIQIKARKVVKFSAGKELKETVSGKKK